MIIVKFQGRLGNQIFQYVFALTVSKKFKTFFLIDDAKNSVFFKYFKSPQIHPNGIFYSVLLNFFGKLIKNRIIQTGTESVDEIKKQFANYSYYDGFFQSDNYFENNREYLKKSLIIKEEYKKIFNEKYGQLFTDYKIIAIHCRLGDYLNWGIEELGGKNLTLPKSYYINSLNQIDEVGSYKIIIVTDDVENIKDKFDFIQNKIIVSEEEIIDFQILQNADKLIISNSSFSWWAAYINNKSATIYAPEYWLGFKVQKEYPIGIMPENFVKVTVY